MKYLFTTTGFYFNETVTFTVSKISDNLYLADSADARISRFILKKMDGTWISDNDMTQFITTQIGVTIEKMEGNRMRKFLDFTRSIFTKAPTKKAPSALPEFVSNLARL